jgi:peptidoglycan-associated lipoprotein
MRKASLFLAAALLLAGCHNRATTPSASDTVLRSSYSDSVADSDMANGSSVNPDSLAAQGLESRDSSFDDISAANLERGILPSVYFEFDKSTLSVAERAKLAKAADYLKTNATRRVLVEGHCDWRGTAEYNLGLGERRAKAAKTYLASLGVEDSRIATVSKGDLEAVTNGTDDQMKEDRRADLLLLKK